jgi:hypothetical protein
VIKEILNRDIPQGRASQPSAFAIQNFYTYSTSPRKSISTKFILIPHG